MEIDNRAVRKNRFQIQDPECSSSQGLAIEVNFAHAPAKRGHQERVVLHQHFLARSILLEMLGSQQHAFVPLYRLRDFVRYQGISNSKIALQNTANHSISKLEY
jgi:hypothetical protein